MILDSVLQLTDFQPTKPSVEAKGRRICFYISSGWCNDVMAIQQHCFPDLESFLINCKSFYSPCEFATFIVVGVYIPIQGNLQEEADQLGLLGYCTVSGAYHAIPSSSLGQSDHIMIHPIPLIQAESKTF